MGSGRPRPRRGLCQDQTGRDDGRGQATDRQRYAGRDRGRRDREETIVMGVLERVELRVRDQLRAKAFYTLLLGKLGHGGHGERDEWPAFWDEHAGAGDWFAFAEDSEMIPG